MATLCKTTVLKVYLDVIEDVISGVRELFIEDGVDEQVLQELKLAWETKLRATKAVDNQSDVDKQGIKKLSEVSMTNGFPKQQQQQTQPQQQQQQQQQQTQQQQQQQTQQQQQQQQQQHQQVVKQVVGQVPPNNHVQTQSVAQILEAKMVPIQITLPAQPGTDAPPRVLTIQVPASALQGNQLHKVLTGPVITATMSLPQPIASQMLQQHVNAAFSQPQQQQINVRQINKTVIQSDGTHMSDSSEDEATPSTSRISCFEIKKKPRRYYVQQFDGPMDSSDEDEDGSEEEEGTDEADDDKDEDEQEVDEGGPEEEPLNSEDDVTDEDPSDLFDTENVVVCQYDKITRSRNKWKFHLKDGIMNLNGEDYLFQKASGDAEW